MQVNCDHSVYQVHVVVRADDCCHLEHDVAIYMRRLSMASGVRTSVARYYRCAASYDGTELEYNKESMTSSYLHHHL